MLLSNWLSIVTQAHTPDTCYTLCSGVLGDPGSSAFNFEHKALIQVPTTSLPADTDPLELAIEIGAEDVCTVSKEESDGVSSEAADSTTAKVNQPLK